MVHFAVEVLRIIFSFLIQRDHVECMTVCRQWHDIIRNHSLYRVVYIDDQKKLDQLMDIVKADPSIGEKVERLILKLKVEKGFNEAELIELFPNVREFTLENYEGTNMDLGFSDPHKNNPWCRQIEKFVETKYDINVKTLLFSGLCQNLRYISVRGQNHNVRTLFMGLTMTPALETLILRSYYFSLQDLEILHDKVTSLKSLELTECDINCSNFPHDIKPATLIKSFQCSLSLQEDEEASIRPYMKYVSQKYTDLEELGFETESVHKKRIIQSYMAKLGPRLKTLIMHSTQFCDTDYEDAFDLDILDESGCQIRKLDLGTEVHVDMLDQLATTEQVNYIQSLRVNRVVNAFNGFKGRLSWDWLGSFTMLKELIIHFPMKYAPIKRYQLNLIDLLDALDECQLETLTLYDLQLDFATSDRTPIYPSIKYLTLESVELKPNVDTLISQSMPNLNSLIFNPIFEGKPVFSFPNLKLSYLEFSNKSVRGPLHTLVVTLDNNQKRLYTTTKKYPFHPSDKSSLKGDISPLASVSSQIYDGSANTPCVTIECKSLFDFFMLKNGP